MSAWLRMLALTSLTVLLLALAKLLPMPEPTQAQEIRVASAAVVTPYPTRDRVAYELYCKVNRDGKVGHPLCMKSYLPLIREAGSLSASEHAVQKEVISEETDSITSNGIRISDVGDELEQFDCSWIVICRTRIRFYGVNLLSCPSLEEFGVVFDDGSVRGFYRRSLDYLVWEDTHVDVFLTPAWNDSSAFTAANHEFKAVCHAAAAS